MGHVQDQDQPRAAGMAEFTAFHSASGQLYKCENQL